MEVEQYEKEEDNISDSCADNNELIEIEEINEINA